MRRRVLFFSLTPCCRTNLHLGGIIWYLFINRGFLFLYLNLTELFFLDKQRKKKKTTNCSLSGSLLSQFSAPFSLHTSLFFFYSSCCLTLFLSSNVSLSPSFAFPSSPSSSSSHCLSVFSSLKLQPLVSVCALSLSLMRRGGWWVCCRSNCFIQPPSVEIRSITQHHPVTT